MQKIRTTLSVDTVATVCYIIVPSVFLRPFLDTFPVQEGDALLHVTSLGREKPTLVYQLQFYVAYWHPREEQIVFLREKRQEIEGAGYDNYRFWFALAPMR